LTTRLKYANINYRVKSPCFFENLEVKAIKGFVARARQSQHGFVLFVEKESEMRRARKLSFTRLGCEFLERREMLSAGSLSAEAVSACVKMTTQPVKHVTILPGSADKVLAQYRASAVGRNFTEFTGMTVVSAGNQYFSQNITGLRLMADMDGNVKNGCETQIASGYVDWETGMTALEVNQYQQVLVQPGSPVKMQIIANFSQYLMGSRIGLGLVEARFNTLQDGQPVLNDSVKYAGVKPVLHVMKSNAAYFSQDWNPEVSTAYAGQKDITLFSFQAWTRSQDKVTVLQKLDFVASQGDLKNGTNYSLWVTKWDKGVEVTSCLQDGVRPVRDKVSFNLGRNKGLTLNNGCQLEVHCDGAAKLAKDPSLALTFGTGFKVKEQKSNKALKGVAVSGGEGQIQVWTSQSPLFELEYASDPGLYVSEIGSWLGWTVPPGAQDITLDQFNVYASGSDMEVNWMLITAEQGSLFSCTNYTLWVDLDNNGSAETLLANGALVIFNDNGNWVFAEAFSPTIALQDGGTWRMEVHADVVDNPSTPILQTSLKDAGAVVGGLSVDKVFMTKRGQPFWELAGTVE